MGVEDCVCHDQLLHGQILDQLFEGLILAQPMEPIHIDIPRSHISQLFHMFLRRLPSPDQIIIKQDILPSDILADIVAIIEEPNLAIEAE